MPGYKFNNYLHYKLFKTGRAYKYITENGAPVGVCLIDRSPDRPTTTVRCYRLIRKGNPRSGLTKGMIWDEPHGTVLRAHYVWRRYLSELVAEELRR